LCHRRSDDADPCQARAIIEAALNVKAKGVVAIPDIMVFHRPFPVLAVSEVDASVLAM
jgi:hypothetical protein